MCIDTKKENTCFMTKKLIVANWKNHPDSLVEAEQILDSVDEYLGSLDEKEFSLIFCPPFVFTEEVGKILKTSHLIHQAELGAQDISADNNSSMTGEVSGPMLRKLGVRYVIVGHSERRWKLGESDEVVNKKLKTVLRNAMIPIVCIGERTRDKSFKDFLKEQTLNTFVGLSPAEVERCIIAYEPVWAISTNPNARPDTPESALESISVIQDVLNTKYLILNTRFLYGGSITSINARDFLGNAGIDPVVDFSNARQKSGQKPKAIEKFTTGFDGVLVGGASVNKEEFVKILAIASRL